MIGGIIIAITLAAAVVYLVVEGAQLNIWWRKRRTPTESPHYRAGIGETWPQPERADAEDTWRKMLDADRSDNEGHN